MRSPHSLVHPGSLSPFTVIRVPHSFDNGLTYQEKFFVVLGHGGNVALCIKATSRTKFYDNNPEKMCGCVCYQAGEVEFFSKRTIIEPDNQFEIPHQRLIDYQKRGALKVAGSLPADFAGRLKAAMLKSQTLDGRRRAWLRAVLPAY